MHVHFLHRYIWDISDQLPHLQTKLLRSFFWILSGDLDFWHGRTDGRTEIEGTQKVKKENAQIPRREGDISQIRNNSRTPGHFSQGMIWWKLTLLCDFLSVLEFLNQTFWFGEKLVFIISISPFNQSCLPTLASRTSFPVVPVLSEGDKSSCTSSRGPVIDSGG